MQPPAIALSHLTVRYGPTIALDDARLEVAEGQVHALLGENGAGKSTIVKVLSGLVRPDSGTVFIFGHSLARFEPRFANELGIRTAFQEISLVKDLTVAQNFLLMEEPLNALGMIRGRALEDLVRAQLEQLGIDSINPGTEVRRLDLPSRQKIEVARAISRKPRILMLDEPTASLSKHDVQWLGEVIERLKESGTTILLISHRMQEVREFCSALTIFRNGRTVGAYAMADLSDGEIIELMIGRSLSGAFPAKPDRHRAAASPAPVLSCENLATVHGSEVSFSLRPGEVLGLAGLDGMGQRELFMTLFGVSRFTAGEIRVRGTTRTIPLSRGRNSLRDWDASRRSQIRGAVPGSRCARKCKFTLASEVSTGWAYSTASRTENGLGRARRSQCGQTGPLEPSAEFQRGQSAKNCCC